MQTRNIAKQFIFDHGAKQEITAEDGVKYNESGRNFTEKQLEKVNAAREEVAGQLAKKWKLDETD